MNWYIGQDIVAIDTHPNKIFKKGDVFTIKGLQIQFCKCKYVVINVGKIANFTQYICTRCNCSRPQTDSVYWFDEHMFAPLDSFVNQEELEEVINQVVTI